MDPKPLKIAEIILLIVVVIGGGWWLMKKPKQVTQTSPTPTATTTPITTLTPMVSATPSSQPSSFQAFIDAAKVADCADQRNDLYVIDNSLVFWAKQGRCADGGYGYVLYGKTPSDRLCYLGDSIAGPRTSCTTEQYRSLFDLIQQNLSDPQLNLPGHTTRLLYRGVLL